MSGAWLSSAQVGPAFPASCRGRRRFSQVKKPTVWEVNSSAQGCLARRGQSPKGPNQPASQPLLMGLGLCRNSRARPGSPGLGKCRDRDRAHAGMRVRRAGLGLVPAQLLTGSVTAHVLRPRWVCRLTCTTGESSCCLLRGGFKECDA